MYEYLICNQPDEDIFFRQCKALEKHIPNLKKCRLLQDVDNSYIQVYEIDGQEVTVHNSYYIGGVFVKSEIELTQFFKG